MMNKMTADDIFEKKEMVCDIHGSYIGVRIPGREQFTNCQTCCDIASEERKKEEDLAIEEERIRRAINNSGIPFRFASKSFDEYVIDNNNQKNAFDKSKSYAENFIENFQNGKCFIFSGKPGTGKTHLSCAIAIHVIKHHKKRVMFSTMYRLIKRIKSTWTQGSEISESDLIDKICNVPLLILDEVGVQFGSESEAIILFDIINRRYEQMLPTIFLSNLDKTGMREYLGERIFDRLREDGCEFIGFDWESKRGNI